MLSKRQLKYKTRINLGKQKSIDEKIEVYKKLINDKNKLNESLLALQKECLETFGHLFKNDICELCNKSRYESNIKT